MTDRELLQQAVYKITELRRENTDDATYVIEDAIWNRLSQCERCGEVNPAEIHTCTPKQEPVAWGITNTRPTEKQPLMMVMLDEPEPSHLVVPLYTAPPQLCCEEYENCTRPCTPRGRWLAHMEDFKYKETEFVLKCKPAWQGLTDEEQLEIMKQFGPGQRGLFADAIEDKLKEKNA